MADKKNRFDGILERAAPMLIRELNEDKRRVTLSFSSEEPVERWGDFEILSHDEGAADLTRLTTAGCLLYNHDRNKVIGRIVSAEIKDKRGEAVVEFDTDDASEVIYQKVRSGTLKGVSVGYIIREYEQVTDKSTRVSTYTATRWEPLEISIVSIPADITVGVGRQIEEAPKRALNTIDYQLKINQNKLKLF